MKDIQIVKTPGHDYTSLIFFVNRETIFNKKTVKGIIRICGDVFWKENYPLIDKEPFAIDKPVLKKVEN